jgi:hypothetical protein
MGSSREKLKRDKLDFTERNETSTYKCDALMSHKRPHTDIRDVRCPDRVLDRAQTEPLPGHEDGLYSSSSSSDSSSSSMSSLS